MHALFVGTSVIPVLAIEREVDAVPLAGALYEGGLRTIEVTFRTPAAAAALAAIRRALPDMTVGAGSLQRPIDVTRACDAGAAFLSSPGLTIDLAAAALATDLPYLPGVATPSEIMAAREIGICVMKLFPAAAFGGAALLEILIPIFPGLAFCASGGLDEASVPYYLTLPNVAMVAGSWMVPREAVVARDWVRIRTAAQRAARLLPQREIAA